MRRCRRPSLIGGKQPEEKSPKRHSPDVICNILSLATIDGE